MVICQAQRWGILRYIFHDIFTGLKISTFETNTCLFINIFKKKTFLKLKISDSTFPDFNFDGLVHTNFYCGLMDGEIGLLILVGP